MLTCIFLLCVRFVLYMSTITQNPPLLILPKFKLEVRNIAFIWWPTYAPCI